jgi:hypothetical protein
MHDKDQGRDPFAFVEEALGVPVIWTDGSQGAPGYYLDTPGGREWLGADFTAALLAGRARVEAVAPAAPAKEPKEPIDWIGIAGKFRAGLRSAVELMDLVMPESDTDDDTDDDGFGL